MTRIAVLRKFFFRDGKDTLQSFMAEVKALTNEDKIELATLAAKELGVELTETT